MDMQIGQADIESLHWCRTHFWFLCMKSQQCIKYLIINGIGGMILFFVDTLEVHSCGRGPWLVAQERQILEKVLLSPPFLLSRDPPLCSCLGQKGAGDKSWRGSWTKRCNCSLWQQTINCPTSPPENWWQILCWVIVVHETWVLVLGGSHSKKCISELGGNQFETKEIKRQSS